MESLDYNTLQFALICIFGATSLFLFLLQQRVPSIQGPLYWGIGGILQVLGMVLYKQHSYSGFIAFVLAGAIIILGWVFYLIGFWKFKKAKLNYWIIIAFPLAELLQGIFFMYVIPLPHIRMANYSLLVAVVNIIIAIEFFKPSKNYLKQILYLGGFTFVLRVLIVMPRALFSLITQFGDASQGTKVNLVLFVFSLILHLIVFGVFISLVFQKVIVQSQKQIDIKNRLYNIIAHDLKGPVGNISELLKLINSSHSISVSEQKNILIKLEKLSISTYELLNNLLLWSHSSKEKFEPKYERIDVVKCIATNLELYEELAKNKNVTFVGCDEKDIFCFADQTMFHTIIRNLLANAIKFSLPGGIVTVYCIQNKKTTQITIKDEGVGIANDKLINFNLGRTIGSTAGTNNERGTGIGLAICRDFIASNYGTLSIDSKPNEGTLVCITLPTEKPFLKVPKEH